VTRFVSFRTDKGWGTAPPSVWDAQVGPQVTYQPVTLARAGQDAAGRRLVIAVHGFNVSRDGGVRSLTELEARLALGAGDRFLGVLWPGDFLIPVINYAFEAADAVACGKMLAEALNHWFAGAAAISLVSHSLGGRLVLQTLSGLSRKAQEACLTAAAVDYDCLEKQYLAAAGNIGRLSVLASGKDKVLRLAYPAGDFLSDLFGDSDSPFRRALGLKGPHRPFGLPSFHQQIPDAAGYGHGDYFPGSNDPPGAKSRTACAFMARAVRGSPQQWP